MNYKSNCEHIPHIILLRINISETIVSTKLQILVVDDDEAMGRALEKLFVALDYKVTLVSTGIRGLELLQEQRFDLILLDQNMPGMRGIEVLQKARQNGCDAVIIMLTGYGNTALAVEAIKAGANDFLNKPFILEELVQMVEKYCAEAQAPEAVESITTCYVQQHCNQIASEEEVAQKLGISARTVGRHIVKTTGMHFADFMHHCRIEQATQLLETTGLNISQIADKVGYKSHAQLTKVFKRLVGTTPTDYRANARMQRQN